MPLQLSYPPSCVLPSCMCPTLHHVSYPPLCVLPSVSLSAMTTSLASSLVSGLVTTMEVRGVTKLYFRDISRALAVVFAFSSGVPTLLLVSGNKTNIFRQSSTYVVNVYPDQWESIPTITDAIAQTWPPVAVGW